MQPPREGERSGGRGSTALVLLGFSTLVTQTVFLREIPAVYTSNELTIGCTLAVWMTLTGAGSALERKAHPRNPHRCIPFLLLALGVLPPLLLAVLFTTRNVIAAPGTSPGLLTILLTAGVLLAPFCLLAGYLFPLLASFLNESKRTSGAGRAYAWESAGGAAGVAIFTVFLAGVISGYQILLLTGCVLLTVSVFLYPRDVVPLWARVIAIIAGTAFLFVAFCIDIDRFLRRPLFPGQELVLVRDTPYGVLASTIFSGQRALFVDGLLYAVPDDPAGDEETVHYALAQVRRPREVLVVGSNLPGVVREAVKHGVRRVDCVEINPAIPPLTVVDGKGVFSQGMHIHIADPRRFVRENAHRYDAVLVNLPEPTTAALNRMFTREFFSDIHGRLRDGGVLSVPVLDGVDYLGEDTRAYVSSVAAALRASFRNVLIVPGNRIFLIASDAELHYEIPALLEEAGVETVFVNRAYFDPALARERADDIASSLRREEPPNADFRPTAYYRTLRAWMSSIGLPLWAPLVVFLPLPAILFRRNAVPRICMGAAGFAGAVFQVTVILTFQAILGSLHRDLGVLFAAFMVGLAVGAALRTSVARKTGPRLAATFATGAVFVAAAPWVFEAIRSGTQPAVSFALILMLSVVMGVIVARIFALIVREFSGAGETEDVSGIYAADLAGAATGAFIGTVYIVPLLGMMSACYVTSGVLAAAGVLALACGLRGTGTRG
ncbi:MAG: hypothetical protein QHI48_08410 [Bacteroidota bacterium]|nr:hypothetical protein [Bacteroidota bacterium]